MDKLIILVKYLCELPNGENDYVDRLNYHATSTILVFSAACIFAKLYGGEPIQCWSSAEWPNSWLQYAHDYCFVESTYYVPLNESLPRNQQHRQESEGYYQWLPFVLIAMMFFCFLPHLVWLVVNKVSDIEVGTIISMASSARKGPDVEAFKAADVIAFHLSEVFFAQLEGNKKAGCLSEIFNSVCKWAKKRLLSTIYCLVKMLTIGINCGLFFFLGVFLGSEKSTLWGINVLSALYRHGEAWEQTSLFPRVTMCDFIIRQQTSKLLNYSVQCVLTANMLNEKIFLFIYYLFAFFVIITSVNLVQWLYTLWFPLSRSMLISQLLSLNFEQAMRCGGKGVNEINEFNKDRIESYSTQSTTVTTSSMKSDSGRQSRQNSGSSSGISVAGCVKHRMEGSCNWVEMPEYLQNEYRKGYRREPELNRQRNRSKNYYFDFKKDFTEDLGVDGILIMQLVKLNSSDFFASLVLGKMFKEYARVKSGQNAEFYS